MKRLVRIAVAVALGAAALPALACGFEKVQPTTTAAPAAAPTVAKTAKEPRVKARKPATPVAPASGQKIATSR